MEEGRVHLPHPINIFYVPHVQTVVIINTAEPVAGRVKGHRNGIWVMSIHLGGKKVADGKEIGDFFLKKFNFTTNKMATLSEKRYSTGRRHWGKLSPDII